MDNERMKGVALAILAAILLAGYIAMGGDGRDLEDHAKWMAEAKEGGACVMW